MAQEEDLTTLPEQYIPANHEVKRVILMYLFVGIFLGISQERSVYEEFHIRQALGWWVVFFVALVFSVPFMLIKLPLISFLFFLLFVALIGLLVFFIKTAQDGKYSNGFQGALDFFNGIGGWIIDMFGV